jgi:hypothetical protein
LSALLVLAACEPSPDPTEQIAGGWEVIGPDTPMALVGTRYQFDRDGTVQIQPRRRGYGVRPAAVGAGFRVDADTILVIRRGAAEETYGLTFFSPDSVRLRPHAVGLPEQLLVRLPGAPEAGG